eukprot:TRINITY_DN14692_c1_g1_i5.p1 TRINITY_DN14692_c1_g1~~TRINITY_DN14692_c1_g1_i5.p1  ORF type:complete len:305 (-),score=38.16 TRINITY_DN14692_c1_g1_i5:60-974(-)
MPKHIIDCGRMARSMSSSPLLLCFGIVILTLFHVNHAAVLNLYYPDRINSAEGWYYASQNVEVDPRSTSFIWAAPTNQFSMSCRHFGRDSSFMLGSQIRSLQEMKWIEFYIKIMNPEVSLRMSINSVVYPLLPVSFLPSPFFSVVAYSGGSGSNRTEWRFVRIHLNEFGMNDTTSQDINKVQIVANATCDYYLSNMQFLSEPSTIPGPYVLGTATTTAGGGGGGNDIIQPGGGPLGTLPPAEIAAIIVIILLVTIVIVGGVLLYKFVFIPRKARAGEKDARRRDILNNFHTANDDNNKEENGKL